MVKKAYIGEKSGKIVSIEYYRESVLKYETKYLAYALTEG